MYPSGTPNNVFLDCSSKDSSCYIYSILNYLLCLLTHQKCIQNYFYHPYFSEFEHAV